MSRRTIPLKDLKVGMYLTGVDRSWFRTPFLRHHFNIRDQSDIEALRHAGIVMVTIDSEKGIEMEEKADVSAEPHPFGQESVFADLTQEETVESLEGLNGLDDPHQSAMQARVGIPEPAEGLPLSDDRSTSGDYPPRSLPPKICSQTTAPKYSCQKFCPCKTTPYRVDQAG